MAMFLFLFLTFRANAQGMLTPQTSESRLIQDLSGVWQFRCDFDNVGVQQEWWKNPLQDTISMPVPASYNDITESAKIRDHIGWAWYETYFYLPSEWVEKRTVLRFGSVHYYAKVWLDGREIMSHVGGHLPFESEIPNIPKRYRLTVAVNNTLTDQTLPPGDITIQDGKNPMYPKGFTQQVTHFDFFNYAGIHRPVLLYTTPKTWIDDFTITYKVQSNGDGIVYYNITTRPAKTDKNLVELYYANGSVAASSDSLVSSFTIPASKVRLWSPDSPYLYTLRIAAGSDVYRWESVGIREIQLTSTQILLNSKPLYLRGVNKHEDSDLRGKGFDNVILVKDFNMLDWLHVNAFRTSHYPYDENFYQWAAKNGIVIIGECPAVGMNEEHYFNSRELSHHKNVMFEMIRRDKNHPSVIMWSLANEPATNYPVSRDYWKELTTYTRQIDPTRRPLTLINSIDYNADNGAADFFDIVCVNRYYGWYSDPGRLDLIERQIEYNLRGWYSTYKKPVILTEYGADTLPGLDSEPTNVFDSDFQVQFMSRYWAVLDKLKKEFVVGEFVWNFADFKTAQSDIRVGGLNTKGILTRQRQPKAAGRALRERYKALRDGTHNPCNIGHE